MKHGEAPTLKQRILIRLFLGLDPNPPEHEKGKPSEWLVVKNTSEIMEIVNVKSGKTETIDKKKVRL